MSNPCQTHLKATIMNGTGNGGFTRRFFFLREKNFLMQNIFIVSTTHFLHFELFYKCDAFYHFEPLLRVRLVFTILSHFHAWYAFSPF